MSSLRITETCACGASIDVTGGRWRSDRNPNNPRGAEEVVERWREDHNHDSDALSTSMDWLNLLKAREWDGGCAAGHREAETGVAERNPHRVGEEIPNE